MTRYRALYPEQTLPTYVRAAGVSNTRPGDQIQPYLPDRIEKCYCTQRRPKMLLKNLSCPAGDPYFEEQHNCAAVAGVWAPVSLNNLKRHV